METIDNEQLIVYEQMLDEINKEYEQSERLKAEIGGATDEILMLRLVKAQRQHGLDVGDVHVSVFDNLFELYTLYEEEFDKAMDRSQLSDKYSDSHDFYLVEVVLNSMLHDKLHKWKWLLFIELRVDETTHTINRCIPVPKYGKMYEILPVPKSARRAVVKCVVVTPFEDYEGTDLQLTLPCEDVDISYHFAPYQRTSTIDSLVTNIAKLYDKDEVATAKIATAFGHRISFVCNSLTRQQFLCLLLQNSHHRLNMDLYVNQIENVNPMHVRLLVYGTKVSLTFNDVTHVLEIAGQLDVIYAIKEFFLERTCDNDDSKCNTVREKIQTIMDDYYATTTASDNCSCSLAQLDNLLDKVRHAWLI